MHFIVSCHDAVWCLQAYPQLLSYSPVVPGEQAVQWSFCSPRHHAAWLLPGPRYLLTPRPVSSLHAVTMSVPENPFRHSPAINKRPVVLLEWMSYSLLSSSGALCQTTEWGTPRFTGKCTQIVLQLDALCLTAITRLGWEATFSSFPHRMTICHHKLWHVLFLPQENQVRE